MPNEINNVSNQSGVQPKQTNKKDEKMSWGEAAKIIYEESIFGKTAKVHKTLNEDIPEKILEKSQSWGWVQNLQKTFGIESQSKTQETKQNNK